MRRKVYAHLNGKSAYYPFGARTRLRRRQKHRISFLWFAGAAVLTLALALTVRQTVFRGGQPTAPPAAAATGETAAGGGKVSVSIADASILPRYRELYAKNHDLVGWLTVPGTGIDYPVLQTPGDNEYYLRRGYDKLYSLSGSLFLDEHCRTGPDATANLIVYGHNMADGSMFGKLDAYVDPAFYAEHPTFTFDTLTTAGTWQVIAAFRAVVGEDALPYYTFFDAADRADWQARYDAITEKALYPTGVTARYGDELLTLSTCGEPSSLTDRRFAVLAKRVDTP